MVTAPPSERLVFTVGHSTRPLVDFIGLLVAHCVKLLADVRTAHRGVRAEELVSPSGVADHQLTALAQVDGLRT